MFGVGGRVRVFYFWGGNIIEDGISVKYDRGPTRYLVMDRSTTLEELKNRIFQCRVLNNDMFDVVIQSPIFTKDMRGIERTLVMEIVDQESLSTILSEDVNNGDVVLYITFNEKLGESTRGGFGYNDRNVSLGEDVEVEEEGDEVGVSMEDDFDDDVQCDSYGQNGDEIESEPEDIEGLEIDQEDEDDGNEKVDIDVLTTGQNKP